MTAFTPQEVAQKLGSGLLSFPVTHFTAELQLDESAYRTNIAWLAEHEAAGLFAADGTGEFFCCAWMRSSGWSPPRSRRLPRSCR